MCDKPAVARDFDAAEYDKVLLFAKGVRVYAKPHANSGTKIFGVGEFDVAFFSRAYAGLFDVFCVQRGVVGKVHVSVFKRPFVGDFNFFGKKPLRSLYKIAVLSFGYVDDAGVFREGDGIGGGDSANATPAVNDALVAGFDNLPRKEGPSLP